MLRHSQNQKTKIQYYEPLSICDNNNTAVLFPQYIFNEWSSSDYGSSSESLDDPNFGYCENSTEYKDVYFERPNDSYGRKISMKRKIDCYYGNNLEEKPSKKILRKTEITF